MVSSACAENKQNIISFDFYIVKTNNTSKTEDCNKQQQNKNKLH